MKAMQIGRWRIIGSLAILIVTSMNCAFSMDKEEASQLFEEANELYDSKDFKTAIEKYELLLSDSYISTALYHNLGLSYHQEGELAKAILNMNRASRLSPMNKDVNHNLRLLRENIEGNYGVLPEFFLVAWYNTIVKLAPTIAWLILHAFCLIGSLILLYFFLIKRVDFGLHRSYMIGTMIGLVVLSIMFASFSYSRDYLKNRNDIAIVMNDNVPLKLGAEANSEEDGLVSQGVKVYIVDQIGDFLKVKLEDLTEGWIHENEIERI